MSANVEPTDEQLARLMAAVDDEWDGFLDNLAAAYVAIELERRSHARRVIAGVVAMCLFLVTLAAAMPMWASVLTAIAGLALGLWALGPWVGDDPAPEPALPPRRVR